MAQYRYGTASITTGTRVVTFQGAELAGNVVPGNLFSFSGENVWYAIASVDTAAKTVTLNSDYTGSTKAAADYAIHRDFTPTLQMPLLSFGDENSAALVGQSFSTMDAAMTAMGAGDGSLSGVISPTWTLQQGMSGAPTENAGLVVNRGNQPTVSILWDELAEVWTFGGQGVTGIPSLSLTGALNAGSIVSSGAVSGTTGTFSGAVSSSGFTGPLTGNASSATKLATTRAISITGGATAAGVNFDGTAAIALNVTALDASVLTGTVASARLTGSYAISVTGNAATATRLTTARTIAVTGAATSDAGTPASFDGSANIAINLTSLDATKLAGTVHSDRLTGSYAISVTGNAATATTLQNARTIALSGDVTATGVSFNGSANISLTTALPALSGLVAGKYGHVTVNTKGQVTAIEAMTQTQVTTALGYTPLSAAGGVVNGNLTVTGDLTIQGDTITMDVGTLTVEDAIIEVARNNSAASAAYGGLKMERGSTDAFWVWNESTDRWTAVTSTDNLATTPTKGDIDVANVYATTVTAALTGNASTATKLLNARTINGASFDGTANITFNSGAVAEGTNLYYTDARARAAHAAGGLLTYDSATGVFSLSSSAVVTSVASKTGAVSLVVGDVSGAAPTANPTFTGTVTVPTPTAGDSTTKAASTAFVAGATVSKANTLTTARTINGVNFDGSANISFGTDAVAEGTTNKYYTDARARAAISGSGSISYNATTGVISLSGSGAVTSVAGRGGDVVLAIADITSLQTALDGKASTTDLTNGLAGKASTTDLTNGLALKLDKTGGTVTGNITFSDDLEGLVFSGGGKLRDQSTTRTVLNANGDDFDIENEAGGTVYLSVNSAGTTAATLVSTPRLHITGGSNLGLAVADAPIQVGATAAVNLIIDGDEIQSRNNGAANPLHLNWHGGTVNVGSGGLSTAGYLQTTGGALVQRNASSNYALTVKQGRGVSWGHVLSLQTDGNVGAGTDTPHIHFITPGVAECSWGMKADGSLRYTTGSSHATSGTERVVLATDGNIWMSWAGAWLSTLLAGKSATTHTHTEYVAKTGDTMSGNLTVSNTYPRIILSDTEWGTRSILHDQGNMGFLNSGGGWAFYSTDAGGAWFGAHVDFASSLTAAGQIRGNFTGSAAFYAELGYAHFRDTNTVLYLDRRNAAGETTDATYRRVVETRRQGTGVGGIAVNSNSTRFDTSSDATMKEDFQSWAELDHFYDNLAVYDFRWKNGQQRDIGVVAQELYDIEPRAVMVGGYEMSSSDDGESEERYYAWTVDYSKLVPHALAGVQAVRERVKELETENATLKSQMSDILARLAALEARA